LQNGIKRKGKDAIAKVKFFFYTILNLDKRLIIGNIDDPIVGIDIKVGEVMSVGKHLKSQNFSICNVNMGDRAITVVTNDMDVKENSHVAVALLPPIGFMGITSEGMFLSDEEGVLKDLKANLWFT